MKSKHLLALGVLAGLAAASVITAQRPAPQLTEQQKLQQRVGELESQLKEAKAKADHADAAQKDAKDYYEKAFNTLLKFGDWAVILIAAVPVLIGLFSLRFVDRAIEQAVSKATSDLETRFDQKLAAELNTLKDSNASQMKQLEESLVAQIRTLGEDLDVRGKFQAWSVQGIALRVGNQPGDALECFRKALDMYIHGRPRHVVNKGGGASLLSNLFTALKLINPTHFDDTAREEIAKPVYNDLKEELALAALQNEDLASAMRDKKQAPPSATPAAQTTAAAPTAGGPNTSQG